MSRVQRSPQHGGRRSRFLLPRCVFSDVFSVFFRPRRSSQVTRCRGGSLRSGGKPSNSFFLATRSILRIYFLSGHLQDQLPGSACEFHFPEPRNHGRRFRFVSDLIRLDVDRSTSWKTLTDVQSFGIPRGLCLTPPPSAGVALTCSGSLTPSARLRPGSEAILLEGSGEARELLHSSVSHPKVFGSNSRTGQREGAPAEATAGERLLGGRVSTVTALQRRISTSLQEKSA